MLWNKLKSDNFETDVIEVVRESNEQSKNELKGLSRDDFSSVYLLFDYDPHQRNTERNLTEDIVKQMIEMRIAQYRITQFVLGDHLVYN